MRIRSLAVAAAATLVVALSAGSASADFSDFAITTFSTTLSTQQAGAHPDVTTTIAFSQDPATAPDAFGHRLPAARVRDVSVDLPPGLLGDPTRFPRCTAAQFAGSVALATSFQPPDSTCGQDTQVGVIALAISDFGNFVEPVYNLTPPTGGDVVARFGFAALLYPTIIDVRVRSESDYGVTATLSGVSAQAGLVSSALTLWGVPSDPSHDTERLTPKDPVMGTPVNRPSGLPRTPFMTNPTRCDGPHELTASADTYARPDQPVTARTTLAAITGCDKLQFDPSMSVTPQTTTASTPTGVDIGIKLRQDDGPDRLATAHLRDARVTLPAGMRLNPGSADGLAACSDQDIRLGTRKPSACPPASKLGTADFDVVGLPEVLHGGVYLRTPKPGDLFRIWLVADAFGVHVKIPGDLALDPATGQITATFDDNPQVPLRELTLHLKGGPRAALSTPSACGPAVTAWRMTPWSADTPVTGNDAFSVDGGCDTFASFTPTLDAGVVNPVAGADSPFTMDLAWPSGQQNAAGVQVTLPPGLVGRLASVPQCPEDRAATGACPAESQVGTTTLAVGDGTHPLWIPMAGKERTGVYLAGPYNGAPFSLVIQVPAQAGPFDLGKVAVRAAIFVDPIDAHVTIKSDPLPQILQGVPLDYRRIHIDIDRPGFMVNPTSCAEMAVSADVASAGPTPTINVDASGAGFSTSSGTVAHLSDRFQVGGCAALPLTPRLQMRLTGRGQTTDGKHPGLEATLTQPHAQSNLRKVKVALPLSLALDSENAQGLCEFGPGSRVVPDCPKESIVGSASVVTPILAQPLSGPVYFVKNVRVTSKGELRRTLPKLVIPLVGENGVRLTITGTSEVDADTQQLITTFDHLPDAPVSRFELKINGGQHGILAVSGDKKLNICRAKQVASQDVDGQTGRQDHSELVIDTAMCPLRVLSTRRTSKALRLRVSGLGAGKVTVSGKGIRKTSRTLRGSTVATVTARLTKAGRKAKRYRVKVTFAPAAGGKARSVRATVGRHKVVAARKADGRVRGTSQRST